MICLKIFDLKVVRVSDSAQIIDRTNKRRDGSACATERDARSTAYPLRFVFLEILEHYNVKVKIASQTTRYTMSFDRIIKLVMPKLIIIKIRSYP